MRQAGAIPTTLFLLTSAVGWLLASFQTSHHHVFTSAAPYFSTECFAHW